MNIAILGAGNVGATLGKAFASVGHTIYFGVPDQTKEKYQKLIESIGSRASIGNVAEAARSAELVVLATPWSAAESAIRSAGDLSGKIIVDCTNPLREGCSGLAVGHTTSAAEQVAGWAPGAKVCKAFNQTGAENMANPKFASGNAAMFVCGDDAESRKTVLQLTAEIGFEAIDAGPLSVARLLEPLAMLWIHLAHRMGLGRNFAFAVLRR